MRQANQDIRRALMVNGVRHWELARAMGVTEATLCRWLREEVQEERREAMFANIRFLADLKNREEEQG